VKKVRGDELDDFCDETRYGYYSWATAQDAVKPTDLRTAERVADLWATDPTATMYQVSRIKQEEEAKSAPTFYSGNARQRMMQMARKGRSWSAGRRKNRTRRSAASRFWEHLNASWRCVLAFGPGTYTFG
jgi:hypothetical protein